MTNRTRPSAFVRAFIGAMAQHKSKLPSKICLVCGRPFTWRRKWARDWEQVRYCSERCRRQRGEQSTDTGGAR